MRIISLSGHSIPLFLLTEGHCRRCWGAQDLFIEQRDLSFHLVWSRAGAGSVK